MNDWVDFYNADHSLIYVNARHFDVHYRAVADGIRPHVPGPNAAVMDYGCGEALHAASIASDCARLVLVDAAPNVRSHLQERFAGNGKIEVMAPDDAAALPAESFDLIVMHSVAQYLDATTLAGVLANFRRLLKPAGRLVLGDVVPPSLAAPKAALALLAFAARHGFFFAAVKGILRIALSSDYSSAALSHYTESQMTERLRAAGFTAERATGNIGHNPWRMTFVARVNRS